MLTCHEGEMTNSCYKEMVKSESKIANAIKNNENSNNNIHEHEIVTNLAIDD